VTQITINEYLILSEMRILLFLEFVIESKEDVEGS
jgi:hypothetical protein